MFYIFSDLTARLKAVCHLFSDEGELGHDYAEYKGMGQAAVNHLLETKNGQVRGAFFRYDIGSIDVVWGKVSNSTEHTGYGIAHILDKHGKRAVDAIEGIIKNGTVRRASNNRLKIVDRKGVLILSETFLGEKRHVIITSFVKQ